MHRRIPTPLVVVILLVIVAGLGGYAYFGDTYFKQVRRMKLGREFLPRLTEQVQSHPEFRNVTVGVGTAKTGCFLIVGRVETHEELANLQRLIVGCKPPLDVVYSLKVVEDYTEKPSAGPGDAANQRRPVGSETNRTSAAAGSGD